MCLNFVQKVVFLNEKKRELHGKLLLFIDLGFYFHPQSNFIKRVKFSDRTLSIHNLVLTLHQIEKAHRRNNHLGIELYLVWKVK